MPYLDLAKKNGPRSEKNITDLFSICSFLLPSVIMFYFDVSFWYESGLEESYRGQSS